MLLSLLLIFPINNHLLSKIIGVSLVHFLITSSVTGFRWHSLLLHVGLICLGIVFLIKIDVDIHILKRRVDV